MIKAHLYSLILTIYIQRILEIGDANIFRHLELVAKTFALDSLVKDSMPIFDAGFFGPGTGELLAKALAVTVT